MCHVYTREKKKKCSKTLREIAYLRIAFFPKKRALQTRNLTAKWGHVTFSCYPFAGNKNTAI